MIKNIRINAYQVGLVFKHGALDKVLNAGSHWLFGINEVKIFDKKLSFVAPIELNVLLQNNTLSEMLEVIEIKEHEVVLYFYNGLFKEVLTTGRYAFWKGYVNHTFTKIDLSKVEITEDVPLALIEHIKLRPYTRKYQVFNHEKALLFINGVLEKELNAGVYYFWNNAIPIEVKNVDFRQQQLEISGQELLTKDKAALRINFFVNYQIVAIQKALMDNKDFEK